MHSLQASGATLYFTDIPFLRENAETIKRLARLSAVTEVKDGTGLYLTETKYRSWLDIDAATARNYREQLGTKRQAQEQSIKQLEGRLANKSYTHNAPKHVVDQTHTQLDEARQLLKNIDQEYTRFNLK